jgi:hypothetical protein
MPAKVTVVRRVPMPNGVTKVISLVDGWKEVVSYTKSKKGKKKP